MARTDHLNGPNYPVSN